MKTNADLVIDGDLAALGESSRRHLDALETSLNSTGVYRDDRPSAEARRGSLAAERRHELALMPLTLSHAYAHRIARMAAGGAALVAGGVLALGLVEPRIARSLAPWFPGTAIVMFAVLAAVFVLLAYVVATWLAERAFARLMREQITLGSDVYRDLDQLAVGPFAVAAAKVRRLDALAVGFPLAGIATLVPLLAYTSFAGLVAYRRPHFHGSTIDSFLAVHSDFGLVAIAVTLGILGSAYVARAIHRAPDTLRSFSHVPFAMMVVLVGLVVIGGMWILHLDPDRRPLPGTTWRLAIAVGGELFTVLCASWAILWWRRHERARLGE